MSKLKVDMRNLVYKLCEGREVPLLVTDMIAELLVHRDLFHINTLSRTLNAQANAIIYRDVVVDLDGTNRSVEKASLLFRTLLTSKTAARAVNRLSLAGDPLQDWRTSLVFETRGESIERPLRGMTPPVMHADFTDFTKEEIELYGHISALSSSESASPRTNVLSIWAVWLYIFRIMPNIQDFSVSSDYFRFPGFRSILQGMVRNSSIAKLRSCNLCLDLPDGKQRHIGVVEGWDDAVLSLFAVPNIQSIAAVVNLKSHAVRQLRPGGSSVTRLELHHWQTRDIDVSPLLAATQSLRYLKYHITTHYQHLDAHPGVGLEFIYDALHHVSDSLQELHISQDVDEDSYHYSPGFGAGYEPLFRRTAELSTMKRLHTLTIPYMALLGCARKDYACDWGRALPSSIRHIVLNDDLDEIYQEEPWTDENLMPVFSRLVEWLSVAKRGIQAADFGLHLAQLDNDFNEPVRQELTRMCEERGVRCSIVKVLADRQRSPQVWNPRGRGRGNLTRGRGRGRGA